MGKFNSKTTKYILNTGRGTLHYYDTQSCPTSKRFNENDPNLKFYDTEDDVIRENQSHFKKCQKCFKGK